VGRGWIERSGAGREQALFMLAGTSLGVGDLLGGSLPQWYDLRDTTNLDALGDPVAGMQSIEMETADGRTLRAGWPLAFCDHVVDALRGTLGGAEPPPAPPAPASAPPAPATAPPAPVTAPPAPVAAPPTPGAPPAPVAAVPGPAVVAAPQPPPVEPGPVPPAAPEPPPAMPMFAPASPAPPGSDDAVGRAGAADGSADEADLEPVTPIGELGPGTAALVLEDVTYLGGYPGQNKKRKKCTATLTRQAVEVAGPNGLAFRVPWDVVRTIEAQNADEARFRMNTKVHRDATALVLECDQDVTVLLEARDCPTIPLRGAIAQLVGGMPVVVV
jgi:hypothetical protein